jgi:hypothetical protein
MMYQRKRVEKEPRRANMLCSLPGHDERPYTRAIFLRRL